MFNTIYNEVKLRKRLAGWNSFNNCEFVSPQISTPNKLDINSILLASPNLEPYKKERPRVTKMLNTFCDMDKYSALKKRELGDLVQDFSTIVIDSYGIIQPQIYCTFNSSLTKYCLATADPNNSVHYFLDVAESGAKVDEENCIGLPLNIAHENEHLRQFALTKKYLNGAQIPQFDEFCILLSIMSSLNLADIGHNTLGEIDIKEQSMCACDPFEIIARYKSYHLIRDVSRFISTKYQEKMGKFLDETLLYDNLYNDCQNIPQMFEPVTKQVVRDFAKNYSSTLKGRELLLKLEKIDKDIVYRQFNQIFDDQTNEAKARDIFIPADELELQTPVFIQKENQPYLSV